MSTVKLTFPYGFGFANRQSNRNAVMLMLKFQPWLCLFFLLGLLSSILLKSGMCPQTVEVKKSFPATERIDYLRRP